ncbi:hypothetical protein BG015_000361 [Linnemannia schmuckeri]|uniref:F-box/LRR-repeat protein 15-like leucin rich repeat domain-containing protein n=1 Tax=Linnemannia schmuckeri TaxID=64567 RepID=A0A9P5RTA5_9FUNG|nr:hypothetical protein BG015_000361 [Linnemannia schmuckeri]
MPALLCSVPLAEPLAHITLPTDSSLCKKQQQQHSLGLGGNNGGNNPFNIPEICGQIAGHLDRHTLTVVVRVSSHWYAHYIRYLWRRVRVESGTVADKSREMLQAFPQVSQHIRHLEWIHLSSAPSSSSFTQDSILDTIDLSNLNADTILLSSWTNELDAATLSRFTRSSAHRLSALQMYNMAEVRGDLLKVARTLPQLRHFTLSLVSRDSYRHNHNRQRSNGSTASSVTSLALALPTDSEVRTGKEAELVQQVTSANSLPDLMDACPQLRMIEILDLPLPTPVSSTSAVVSEDQEDDDDIEEDENQDQDQEQEQEQDVDIEEGQSMLPSEKIAPKWVPMHYLTTINLHATAISGSTLTALFARSPQLVKLNLGQNTPLYLSDFHIDPSLCMSKLSTLILSGCHFLDGHGYKEIFKASPNLLHLDIPQTNVDDAALAVLGHQCLQLTDLNLDECLQITDQGIRDMLSHPRPSSTSTSANNNNLEPGTQERYENGRLQCLSVSNCTELTGQGIHHILMTCGRLRSLEFQQPEIMPEALFPHTLETDDDDQQQLENPSSPSATIAQEQEQAESATTTIATIVAATVYPTPDAAVHTTTATSPTTTTTTTPSVSWACQRSLELLRIKNLNTINTSQSHFLNERLRELRNLKALHIGGSQLELSILNGLGHQLENLYIDDLAREVDVNDVRWLVDHTPNLTRLWCRQLIRHSEPWKMLRAARTHLKLW